MAAVSKKGMSPQRMQPTTFVLEGRPKSSESFGTTRQRFLNAPIPEPENEDDYFSLRPQKKTYSPVGDKKKKKQKKTKKKKGTKDSFDPNEDTREALRLQELKEWLDMDTDKSGRHHELKIAMLKHMRVLDDLGKLKAHYYLEYMDALTDKVEDQRKEIQRKTDANDRRILRKEKKEKKEAQRIKMEMHRPPVSSDNTFLRGLPKNHYHKIVVLQDQLIREGHIRRDEELRAFWAEVQRPEVYRRMFGEDGSGEAGTEHHFGYGSEARTKHVTKGDREIGAADVDSQASGSDSVLESKRSLSLGSLRQVDPSSHPGYLAQIQEVREPSRPGSMGGPYVQSWMNEPKTKKKHSQPVVTRRPVHPKVLEMEAKCPRVEFPQLAAFTLDLEPPKEDPEVEEMRQDFRTRARIRNSEVRRLRKMYQNSLTNSAATQRLFDMKDELMQVLCGPALGDVVQLGSNGSSDHREMLQRMRREEEEEEEEEERKKNERLSILPAGNSTTSHPTNPHPRSNPGSRPTPSFAIERISEEGDIEEDDDEDEEEEERKDRLLAYSSGSSSRRSSLTSTESEIRRNTPVVSQPKRPQPLTMGAVMDKTEVKVVECPSTLWINYGKFLPSVH